MQEVDYASLTAREAEPDPTSSECGADMQLYMRDCLRVLATGIKRWPGDAPGRLGPRVLNPEVPYDHTTIERMFKPQPLLLPIAHTETTDDEGGGAEPPPQLQQQQPALLPAATDTPQQLQVGARRMQSKPFGCGTSRYFPAYLTPEQEQDMLEWCRNDVRFQIYNCTGQQRVKGGEPRLKAPKAEFYLLDGRGRRPHYKWAQLNTFDHAGEPMPPILKALCTQLNTDFSLEDDDRFNHCLIICNEQSGSDKNAHCAPPHADKIQKGFFVDVSLGYPREFQLIDAKSDKVAASKKLASGSLAYITADDNGRLVQGSKRDTGESKVQGTRYKHAVPVDTDQPRDQPRFSIVFRPITDHPKGAKCGEHFAKVNETKAASVRPDGDLWREYVPLCRGGTGAAPAPAPQE